MNFVYPAFLYALTAIAIPIIIHLFNFQKPKRILFTNVRFLRQINDANQSKLKVKHILILLSRIGFVIFLVLLFAQPFLPGINKQLSGNNQTFGVYLDNSPTMFFDENGYKRIDLSKKNILSFTETVNKDAKYILLENSYLYPQKPISISRTKDITTEIENTFTYRNLAEINDRFKLSDEKLSAKLFFSDFQKNFSEKGLEIIKVDSSSPIFLVPLAQNTEYSNVFIDSVWTSSPFIIQGKEIEIFAKITNFSANNSANITCQLITNEIQTGTSTTEINANTSSIISFKIIVRDKNELKCKISISTNDFAFDNQFYFVIKSIEQIKVLEIYQTENTFIRKVYSNNEIFSFEQQQVNNLQFSKMNEVDLIILNSIQNINQAIIDQLIKHQQNGGSVVFIPSENGEKSNYSNFLNNFGISIIDYFGKDTSKTNRLILAKPDLKTNFFKDVFEKAPKNIDLPFVKPILGVSGFQQKILQTNDSQAFLSYKKLNKGKIYVFSCPLVDKFTTLPKHSLFVPVMYKIAQFSINENQQLYFTLGNTNYNIQLPKEYKNGIFELVNEKTSVVPSQSIKGRNLNFEISNLNSYPGFYTLKEKQTGFSQTIALNITKKESETAFYTYSELKKITEGIKHIQVLNGFEPKTFDNDFKEQVQNKPLWQYCLYICLFFLLIEILLIRFL